MPKTGTFKDREIQQITVQAAKHIAAASSLTEKAHKSGDSALMEHRATGELFLRAKLLLRGKYLQWTKEKFDLGKTQCANLTALAKNWDTLPQALAWVRATEPKLEQRAHTLDGAVLIIRRWKNSTKPNIRRRPRISKKQTMGQTQEIINRLEAEIVKLNLEKAELERELELEQKQADRFDLQIGRTRRNLLGGVLAPEAHLKHPLDLDLKTIEKAQKIAELWRRGSTEPERSNAEARIRDLAKRFGWDFDWFIDACKIESSVD